MALIDEPSKILLVDDRRENLLALEELIQMPEIEVLKANSGNEALALSLDHKFAVVLMDVHMPEMDGYETATLMRGSSWTRETPIIFVTADYEQQNVDFNGVEGPVDFIYKPVHARLLMNKIRLFLQLERCRAQLEDRTAELKRRGAEMEQLREQLTRANQDLQALSLSDNLTGIPNRRNFDESLEREWGRSRRNGTVITLILVDIDHFENYNGTYGHDKGDACIRKVASTLRNTVGRSTDLVARYGGVAFAVLLPEVALEGARLVAEVMREQVERLEIENRNAGTADHVTVSIGVTSLLPKGSSENLTQTAEQALQKAKQGGRNRVVVLS